MVGKMILYLMFNHIWSHTYYDEQGSHGEDNILEDNISTYGENQIMDIFERHI